MNAANFIMIIIVLCLVFYTFLMHFGVDGTEKDTDFSTNPKRRYFPNAQGIIFTYLLLFFTFPYLYTLKSEHYTVSFTFLMTKICFVIVIYTLILTLFLPFIKENISSRAIGAL